MRHDMVLLPNSALSLMPALSPDAGIPLLTGGWLGMEASKKPEESQQLTFSFQAQQQGKGGAAAAQSAWQISAGPAQTAEESSMLRQALLGLDRQGGLYLTPTLYRPTVQVRFRHTCEALMDFSMQSKCMQGLNGSTKKMLLAFWVCHVIMYHNSNCSSC